LETYTAACNTVIAIVALLNFDWFPNFSFTDLGCHWGGSDDEDEREKREESGELHPEYFVALGLEQLNV